MSLGAMLPRLAEACVRGHPDADRKAVAGELAKRLGPEAALRYLLDLPDSLGTDELRTIGTLAKKTRNWRLAVKTWEELASRDCPKGLLELLTSQWRGRRYVCDEEGLRSAPSCVVW